MIGGSSPQNLISGPTAWSSADLELELDFSASLDNPRNRLDTRAGLTNAHQIFNPTITYSVYLFISHHSYTQRRAPSYHRQASLNLSRDQQRPQQKKTVTMGKLTSTIGIPIKLLNEAQVRLLIHHTFFSICAMR